MTIPVGFQSQVALSATSSFSSSSKWIQIQSESIKRQGTLVDADGIRGTRSHDSSRVRTAPYKVGGQMTVYCDINVLDVFLAYVLGSGPTSHVYSLADALSSFYLMIDRNTAVFTYGPCYVSKAAFSASAGTGDQNMLKLVMDIEAGTETVGSAGTFPTGMTTDTNRPFLFADAASGIELGSTQIGAHKFDLTIDNHLLADRFVNELTRSQIPPVDRTVTWKMSTQYTATEAAFYGVGPGSAGTAAAVFTNAEETINSTVSTLTFSFPGALQYPTISPTVQSKQQEINLDIEGTARTTTSGTTITRELTITNTHG